MFLKSVSLPVIAPHKSQWGNEEYLEYCYNYCEQLIEQKSKSFAFASQFLDTSTRKSVVSLYAFCRMVDDIVDNAEDQHYDLFQTLDELNAMVDKLYFENVSNDPILFAFGYTLRKHQLSKEYIIELIEGMKMDLTKNRYQTIDELLLYSYRVAGVVGLLMLDIFVNKPSAEIRHLAMSMGLAMQITNILRDVKEDYEMGRIYLPKDVMDHFGVSEMTLVKQNPNGSFKAMVRYLAEMAKGYYAQGFKGVEMLPPGADYVVAMSGRIYQGILKEIEQSDYDVFRKRHYVPKWKKVLIAMQLRVKYRKSINRKDNLLSIPS